MRVIEYYSERKRIIDDEIRKILKSLGLESETPAGGKRLRGVLTILVAESLGGDIDSALPAAIAIELAHAASLDVDDIVDFDVERRGKPATWVLNGIRRTVLMSHQMIAQALRMIRSYGTPGIDTFIDTYYKMVGGEFKELETEVKNSYSMHKGLYTAIIATKTASLWSAAARMGAISARRYDYIKGAGVYGMMTGLAFQVADDLVDLVKLLDEPKKLLVKLTRSPSTLLLLYELGVKPDPRIVLGNAKEMLVEYLDRAEALINDFVMRASMVADTFPNTEYKDILKTYPKLSVDMMLEEALTR